MTLQRQSGLTWCLALGTADWQLGHMPAPLARLGFLWLPLPWSSLELSPPQELGAVSKLRPQAVLPGPLSAAEIAASAALGPDQLLSPASPQLNLVVSGANMTLTWPVANAGYTLQSRTNLVSGDWTAVTSPAPQIVGSNWQVIHP